LIKENNNRNENGQAEAKGKIEKKKKDEIYVKYLRRKKPHIYLVRK